MGFLIRSVFWLGVVYSAMPFDWGAVATAVPAPGALACASAASLAAGALGATPIRTFGEARLACAAAQATLTAATPAAAPRDATPKPARAKAPQSTDTLNLGDRRAPWRGAQRTSAG